MTGAKSNPNSGNRMVLLLIAGIPVTVILVATWMWFFVVRGDLDLVGMLGTANRGALVQPPRQIDDQELLDDSAQPLKVTDLEPRWTMVIPAAGGRCGEACERSLYETRQIHVAMGKDMTRLRRLYVSPESAQDTLLTAPLLSDGQPTPGEDFSSYLADEHNGLQALSVSAAGFRTLFPEYEADKSSWYLIDPAGWIMMSYNRDVPYKDVITDLKFLLKNSGG